MKTLADKPQRDDVITFEELGVDRLYVDEAHNFKNLYYFRAVLAALGLVVALCAGYLLSVFVVQPVQMQADVQELKHIKAEPIPVSGSELKTKAVKKQGLSQFQRMQTVNKDIKG